MLYKETDIRNVKKGTPVYIDGKEYEIAEISEIPVKLKEEQLGKCMLLAVDESVYTDNHPYRAGRRNLQGRACYEPGVTYVICNKLR